MLAAGSGDFLIFPLAWETRAYLKAELKDPTGKGRVREGITERSRPWVSKK